MANYDLRQLSGAEKARFVRDMFTKVVPRYDLVNTLGTWGRDQRWRRLTVQAAAPEADGSALDVATGTAKLALELAKAARRVVGVDFNKEMLAFARKRLSGDPDGGRVDLVLADALRLPFADDTFVCATVGFATRNVADISLSFEEMRRVVRPRGRVVCLDMTRPRSRLFAQMHRAYLYGMVATHYLGRRDRSFRFFAESLHNYPSAEQLAGIMADVGLRDVGFRRLNLGTIAIHVGVK